MPSNRFRLVTVGNADANVQDSELSKHPQPWNRIARLWFFKGTIYRVEGADHMSEEEIALRIEHKILKDSGELLRMRKEIEAYQSLTELPTARRERISEAVRMFVWRRDEGKCAECGSRADLEFDHIIPVVEGGATTERNIQLLCGLCNRKKGRRV